MGPSGREQTAPAALRPYHCALVVTLFETGREAEATEEFEFLPRRDYEDMRRENASSP